MPKIWYHSVFHINFFIVTTVVIFCLFLYVVLVIEISCIFFKCIFHSDPICHNYILINSSPKISIFIIIKSFNCMNLPSVHNFPWELFMTSCTSLTVVFICTRYKFIVKSGTISYPLATHNKFHWICMAKKWGWMDRWRNDLANMH